MLHSIRALLVASIVLPPAGLVLLWLRGRMRTWDKILWSMMITIWCIAYLMLFFGLRFELDGSGARPIPTFGTPERHYGELERSGTQQSASPAFEAAQPTPAPAAETKPAEPRPAGSSYWTDFRGPNRDGRYDQAPIGTDWPAKGPPWPWHTLGAGG